MILGINIPTPKKWLIFQIQTSFVNHSQQYLLWNGLCSCPVVCQALFHFRRGCECHTTLERDKYLVVCQNVCMIKWPTSAPTCKISYVYIRLIYVNMQHATFLFKPTCNLNYVDMQHNHLACPHNYAACQHKYVASWHKEVAY